MPRALLSVYDKSGIAEFATGLHKLGFELVASGTTAKVLDENTIPYRLVEDLTGYPRMLDDRVKTLHPAIHGGILADRSKPTHLEELEQHGIGLIDIVVCNLYPFTANPSVEMIDVGGPTMVRAAAKNHGSVAIVVDPGDYERVLEEVGASGSVGLATRTALARKAFAHTASYDAAIAAWLEDGLAASGDSDALLAPRLHLVAERAQSLRYGENPHQQGARYRLAGRKSWWDEAIQHGGKELSYLNVYDTDAAWRLVHEMGDEAAVAIIKHANPCGAAVAADATTAYRLAHLCDPVSAFGGIVAINRTVPVELAEALAPVFTEVVVAPSYDPAALEVLLAKKNMRVLEAPLPFGSPVEYRSVDGGLLVQEVDVVGDDIARRSDWRVVSKALPDDTLWRDLELAWRLCAHVKSNAITIVTDRQAVGIGAGQQSRVDAAEIAVKKAGERAGGGAAASDAFFPFRDGLDVLAAAGVRAVVQPGGSMRDDEVIAAADEHGIVMVLTGTRHFRH